MVWRIFFAFRVGAWPILGAHRKSLGWKSSTEAGAFASSKACFYRDSQGLSRLDCMDLSGFSVEFKDLELLSLSTPNLKKKANLHGSSYFFVVPYSTLLCIHVMLPRLPIQRQGG